MAPLPAVPIKHSNFLSYIQSKPDVPIEELVRPYNEYDVAARRIFAQEPEHPISKDNHANIVPMFDASGSADLKIRARDLGSESAEEAEKYLLPLGAEARKPHGSPAVAPSFDEFRENFTIFTEGALSDMDWSHVVAAGSAVVTSLLPVPEKYRRSKRGLRQYYHEEFAPASDVDLFLYGLTEEQAVQKIKHIEETIRNSILYETTTIRTKHTITIASQYPTRHVQIVLRIYKSIAEILTGFDVDCSCAAFDGKQVLAAPRAIASYITQRNQIDITRRSPSYENRLSKYSHRGFEVYWPQLDRSKIDPTIFERSFNRTEGLARLLVLEKLPKVSHREAYMQKRRAERGRPPVNVYLRRRNQLRGNIKEDWEDEVPEWQEEDQVSSYHTFTIPYGRKFNAKKIEKLIYTRDLLLNAEWNQPGDRKVYLHRHPAFFGEVEHVIGDCCGFCPQPTTDEEKRVAEEESKTYVSGNISFIKDDPGRQEIGSFNPITDTDWTEMAYISGTEKLCQAIVAEDLEAVKAFFDGDDANPDRRDYTGRTPLQLACMSSSAEVVQCLVDHGARLISRMADGKTALHIASTRGNIEIIRILLTKSNLNEEEEAAKESSRKSEGSHDSGSSPDDVEMKDADDLSRTSASFVKIDHEDASMEENEVVPTEENELEPDIYDINAISWDSLTSPLHLAILHGHTEAAKELVTSFGADVMLPIKIVNDRDRSPQAAILNLVLVLSLPLGKAREMSKALLEAGASLAQADMDKNTALHYIAQSDYAELIDVYVNHDGPAVQRAIQHMRVNQDSFWSSMSIFSTALMHAIGAKKEASFHKLLQSGAKPYFELADFLGAMKAQLDKKSFLFQDNDGLMATQTNQPVLFAAENQLPLVAIELLRRGADPNSELRTRWGNVGRTVLDATTETLKNLRDHLKDNYSDSQSPPIDRPSYFEKNDEEYLKIFDQGSYKMFSAKAQLRQAHKKSDQIKRNQERTARELRGRLDRPGAKEEKAFIEELVRNYETLEQELINSSAKLFKELHPEESDNSDNVNKTPPSPKEQKTPHFKFKFEFSIRPLMEETQDGTLQLFEAAWKGDLETIKELTLGMWGPSHSQSPLEISVFDQYGFSCFSIAILRGHLQVARVILEIVKAQYHVKPQKQKRFEICSDGDFDEDSEYESDGSANNDRINIVGRDINDQFTYDNVGQIVTDVQSRTSPLQVFDHSCRAYFFFDEWPEIQRTVYATANSSDPQTRKFDISGLIKYAIVKNDLPLLDLLLEIRQQCVDFIPNIQPFLLHDEFQLAISLSRVDCLTSLIQKTAVGLPLAKLAKESGVKSKEKYEFYPGLSIRGYKRKDWASAGLGNVQVKDPEGRPPLLIAALQGNLTVVEWFLGTAPGRHYVQYVSSHMDVEDVQKLAKSKLGLEGSILNWLQTRNNLVLHCAIISKPSDESERLVEYLVERHPECLEVRSAKGLTPLALAFSIHRLNFAKILINAGANQAMRDSRGHNLLHLLLNSSQGRACKDRDEITPFIDLLDKELATTMLVERAGDESQTPLLRFLDSVQGFQTQQLHYKVQSKPSTSVLTVLLDLGDSSNQKHLELLDGSGNTPVHKAVKVGWPQILELMLDRRPDLLYRENATGNTPLDMAVDAWTNAQTRAPPPSALGIDNYNFPTEWRNVARRSTLSYHPDFDDRSKEDVMYQICRERSQNRPGKRRLVSLFDANEVAKRLAAMGRRGNNDRYGSYGRSRGKERDDEVDIWSELAWDL